MFEKNKINKEIKFLEDEIKFLEIKRARSQAAIIDAVISHEPATADDLQFFRLYTSEIEVKREQLQKLKKSLEPADGDKK